MRRGDVGPSGVAAIGLVVVLDVACLGALLRTPSGAVLAGIALLASRLAPAVACCGLPPARPDGLGHLVAGSVRVPALILAVVLVGCTGALATWLAHLPWYAAVLVPLAALVGAWSLTHRAARRLGGVTGDVIGAAIETALGAALVVASVLSSV
jgi:adenosylcobinamide-GDP ribazoletransferase